MRYDLSRGRWNREDFLSCASVRVPYRLEFGQEEDCIHNVGADRLGDEYAYVSLVRREPSQLPCLVETECSFVSYGAPLALLAEAVDRLPDGRWQYGRHIEIVAWEKGVNVWDLTPDPQAPKGQRTVKLAGFQFPIAGGEKARLAVRAFSDRLEIGISAGERTASFTCACALRGPVYAGLTACEGENRFYSFAVE